MDYSIIYGPAGLPEIMETEGIGTHETWESAHAALQRAKAATLSNAVIAKNEAQRVYDYVKKMSKPI